MINKLNKSQASAARHLGLVVRDGLLQSRPATTLRVITEALENPDLKPQTATTLEALEAIADEMALVADAMRQAKKVYAQTSTDRQFGQSESFAAGKPTKAQKVVLADMTKEPGTKPWQFIKFQDGSWRNRSDCQTVAAAVGYASRYFADTGRSAENPIGTVFAVNPAEDVAILCKRAKNGKISKSQHALSDLIG